MNQQEFFKRYEWDVRSDRIGSGAFGTVYKVYDTVRDEWKALKISEVRHLDGREFSLIDEFHVIKDLSVHKNVANYESVFQFQMPNGLFDYAVMQYYPDGNLAQFLKGRFLNTHQKQAIAEGLIHGLAFLHQHKIIHRDLKPGNILISRRNELLTPKIADFGLSKIVSSDVSSMFSNSIAGGTLNYTSPEQLLGHKLRFNTDLWSLGVILCELFIDKRPFDPESVEENSEAWRRATFQNILHAPLPKELSICPSPYKDIIQQCLVKDSGHRASDATVIEEMLSKEYQKINYDDTIVLNDVHPANIKPSIKREKTPITSTDWIIVFLVSLLLGSNIYIAVKSVVKYSGVSRSSSKVATVPMEPCFVLASEDLRLPKSGSFYFDKLGTPFEVILPDPPPLTKDEKLIESIYTNEGFNKVGPYDAFKYEVLNNSTLRNKIYEDGFKDLGSRDDFDQAIGVGKIKPPKPKRAPKYTPEWKQQVSWRVCENSLDLSILIDSYDYETLSEDSEVHWTSFKSALGETPVMILPGLVINQSTVSSIQRNFKEELESTYNILDYKVYSDKYFSNHYFYYFGFDQGTLDTLYIATFDIDQAD